MPLPLADDEAHLWYVSFAEAVDPALLAGCFAILSPDEQVRQQRFLFEKDRHQYLVSHALVRTVLSHYADVPPAAWRFTVNRHGKPEIAASLGVRLSFNLSHTQGLAALVVARDREIGVDVEYLERTTATLELAERFFAPSEVAALQGISAASFRPAFFAYWTLKEAYLKARGFGLALPLSEFAFHLRDDRSPTVRFTAQIPDDPASWQFVHCRPGPQHLIAIAARRAPGADLTLTVRKCVPAVRTSTI